MAGVLGNPLGYKGGTGSSTNLNDITNNGYYFIYKATGIENTPFENGCLIVLNIDFFLIQIGIGDNTGLYYRSKWGKSSFTSWVRIA